MEDLSKKTLDIKFKKTPDYKIVPATGAWGGATPQGEVLCSFFVEHNDIPESIKYKIGDGVAKSSEEQSPVNLVREFQMGVIMRPDIAKSIGQWLIKKAEEIMNPRPNLNF
ncbi:MAG: hypothetical protein J7M20_07470 [Deltaproteobacteria bacterium]|nr:hypothetical protein [Deltaproteobacteria bacterium]